MLEAMRNLGILKMIEEFGEIGFDRNALNSVDSFLEQRNKAIECGKYASLQFESIASERIGIFSIDENANIKFHEEAVSEDSWK